ncbi:hypothetical protein Y032_0140g2181 [Ancylostoma ceylanicum]|uniref:Uncharacterized protein n=1 Tax=Ancylostoma ceylanicum TaxID=53326 RepID=A0A016T4E7_9BILA|nr:hypothetical protein Y032_0140g2181 [Ancylostoma ceylanicum]
MLHHLGGRQPVGCDHHRHLARPPLQNEGPHRPRERPFRIHAALISRRRGVLHLDSSYDMSLLELEFSQVSARGKNRGEFRSLDVVSPSVHSTYDFQKRTRLRRRLSRMKSGEKKEARPVSKGYHVV